ncbi:SAF domain-containing protein [Oligoflexia bacterium]|nr:SAF domain-containing protein [Oligoflexia bacterium]
MDVGFDKTGERGRLPFIVATVLLLFLFTAFILVYSTDLEQDSDTDSVNLAIPAALGTIILFTPDRFVRAGTKLSEVKVIEVYWPEAQAPEGAVRDVSEVVNLYAKVDLPAGVPLQKPHLTAEDLQIQAEK